MYKQLEIRGRKPQTIITQGGMGVGVSRRHLAASVAIAGGIGVISTAGLDRLVSKEIGKEVGTCEAVEYEVRQAKKLSNGGLIGVNIMAFLQQDRDAAACGAMIGGADFIFTGAGLYLDLPKNKNNPYDTAFVPIVSSAQALRIFCQKWEKFGRRPDAAVLEGPLAGGHLGFRLENIGNPDNRLEILLPQVKEVAKAYGDFPIIVAGGIYDRSDIQKFVGLGADGVQIGTRFLATEESDAPDAYKQAVIEATEEDIAVVANSPCGFPFRTLKTSPMYRAFIEKKMRIICDKGYLLQRDKEGKNTLCLAKNHPDQYFCICNGLLSSAGYFPGQDLYTVGANAGRVKKIISVKELMDELR